MHRFEVWAPTPRIVKLKIDDFVVPMDGPDERGYWHAQLESANHGAPYAFLLDDDPNAYPDPRSLDQPQGVHGLSRLYDHSLFSWSDNDWKGLGLKAAILYELHVGTFTQEGTLDSATERVQYLADLGVTHVELMPVAEASGSYGWGYDGADLYAVHHRYGGPDALKRFANACHAAGLAVILDVVYNHFGPVGNYASKFGPYFTANHHTPWGDAINFEGRGSDEVRKFFIDNTLMWMRDFHIDGLRLDAVHEMMDRSAVHFLEELSLRTKELASSLDRKLLLIAESDLNDPRLVNPIAKNGLGLDAQWSDDFHHALFTVLHQEAGGYYDDFGTMAALAKAIESVFVFDGEHSRYRNRRHGRPVHDLSGDHFVVCIQNHDQVGNRAIGERLEHLVGTARTKIALGLLMTCPFVPLLFQGEEFAASAPFQYFTNHEEPELARAVAEGRKREFAAFGWSPESIPNPNEEQSFLISKLDWSEIDKGDHAEILAWTRRLIQLRRETPSLHAGDRSSVKVEFNEASKTLEMKRGKISVLINLGEESAGFTTEPGTVALMMSPAILAQEDRVIRLAPDGIAILKTEGA